MPWLEWVWQRLAEEERVYLFSNATEIERELKVKVTAREIRPIPTGFNFTSTIWVLGEYMVMIMTGQQPHYAFQIKDAVFAANFREIIRLLWWKC